MTGRRTPRRWLAAAFVPVASAAALAEGARAAEPGRPPAISARTALTPREHFFADRVSARVDVTVDRNVVDPDGVRLLARFAPYRRTGRIRVDRRDLGRTTIVTFTTSLQCIDRACLRGADASTIRFPPAVVQYFLRADPTPTALQTAWPELTLRRRLPAGQAAAPVRGRTDEFPDVSYRIPPAVLGSLLAAASAALVLAAPAAAALRLRRRTRPPTAPPVAVGAPLDLESLLVLVERAPDEDARRMALDLLARSLPSNGPALLSERARRLAWASSPPAEDELARLAEGVRRSLEELR